MYEVNLLFLFQPGMYLDVANTRKIMVYVFVYNANQECIVQLKLDK